MLPPDGITSNTKILATLGPASWEPDTLRELITAGVNVFRINGSHSDHATIRRLVARCRRAAVDMDRPIGILLDLQGPKIRLGKVDGALELNKGDTLTVVMDPAVIGKGKRAGTTYPEMADDVKAGDTVLFADGALGGTVSRVHHQRTPKEVEISIEVPGSLTSNKGINLPGVKMSVPSLTEKDRGDLLVGLDVGVDFIALSFVRHEKDLIELQEILDANGANVPIIAKIEKPEALENLQGILDHCTGVMVARGDLGVEVPLESIPVHQKEIIAAANRKGKLVITATQMLDSMERNPRPTRAEVTDVANAIIDGTDAIMLSGETSVGRFPVEAVQTMKRIAHEVETSQYVQPRPATDVPARPGPAGAAYQAAAFSLSDTPRPMLVVTWSGLSARLVSKVRPEEPLFALSPNQEVVDQLSMVWGVIPFRMPLVESMEALVETGTRLLVKKGYLKKGDELVVLGGTGPVRGSTNFVKWHVIE